MSILSAAQVAKSAQHPFCAWLAERLGTHKWCVATRLTARMRESGYDMAISERRYRDLLALFEAQTNEAQK